MADVGPRDLDRKLLGAFERAPIGMAIATPTGHLQRVNPALSTLLGRDLAALTGSTLFEVTHSEDVALAHENCAGMQTRGLPITRHECRMHSADGRTIHVLVSTARVDEDGDEPAYLVMHVEDISDRKRLEAELIRQSLHDPLTGLANRTLLLEKLRGALARSERTQQCTSMVFLDLNGFKLVNDAHGHGAGDELLKQLANRVTGLLRPADTAARLGGDEFVVLCEDTDRDLASRVAERLRVAASTPFDLGSNTVVLSAAVGVSTAAGGAEGAEALLHRADQHMYDVKRSANRGTASPHD